MRKILQGPLVLNKEIIAGEVEFDTSDGRIINISNATKEKKAVDYYYNDDHLVFPGMIDIHVHCREDVSGQQIYKEDFLSASEAALNGGVTCLCDMPNNIISPIDSETYQAKLKLCQKAKVPILPYAGIGPKTQPLSQHIPYKVYMGPSVGDLYFKTNEELETAIERYQKKWVSFHCEDPVILEQHKNESTHFLRRPLLAENLATEFALKLIEKYQLKGKLCHYSSGEGLNLIRQAKQKKLQVTAEVTPQHLFFSQEALQEKDYLTFQMNPPIRSRSDADELLKGVVDGTIDFLATDHAPHTLEEKRKGTSGLTGLDTYGPFVVWLMKVKKVDPLIIRELCCARPAAFVGEFKPEFKMAGSIQAGHKADFTILNLKKEITIDKQYLRTKVRHSPFLNITLPGSVESVFLDGKPIQRD